MKTGIFALLDCLGFKGIWKREQDHPEVIIDKLQRINEAVMAASEEMFAGANHEGEPFTPNILLLSDTVVISLTSPKAGEGDPALISTMIFKVAAMVRKVVDIYLTERPHLVLRGCLSYGKHECKDNFIFGPVVDSVADNMERADGGFIWLLPEASAYLSENQNRHKGISIRGVDYENVFHTLLPHYRVPLKNSSPLPTFTVNPVWNISESSLEERKLLYDRALRGESLDVWVKRENTMEYINHCVGLCLAHLAPWRATLEAEEK